NEGEVAGAVVMMLKGANSSEVIKNVKERIAQIQKGLPEGVIIEPFLDRTKMVNNAIGTVEQNLLEGALIVVFVLVMFLGNFRAGFLVASVIPLSMLFAVILMNLFGVSGNLMSLGALDFGLIVDGAVIIVEAVMHRLSHNKKFSNISSLNQTEMDAEVRSAASKMMNSAVFGQVIILVVYLPIFTLQGIEGKMFKPMAQTVAFALLGAFVLSLTYIPMMSAFLLSKKTKHKPNISDRLMSKTETSYQKALERILRVPKTVITVVVVLFVISIAVLSSLGGEFIPALEEGDFAVETRVLVGSNLKTTIEATQKAAEILKARFPEIEKVVTKIGSGEIPTDPMPMEAADMMIILKDKKDWVSAGSFNELAEKMSTAVSEVPGLSTSFQYPVQMRFNELMTGAKQDVVCKIFGENLDTLAKYSEKLGSIISGIEGAQNLYVEKVIGMPEILIKYNRATMAQYGISISDVNKIINAAFAGESAGLVFEGEKRFDMVVRLNSGKRKDLEDVRNMLVLSSSGTQVPLYQLASIEKQDGPNQIQREDTRRRIIIGFNSRDRDVESIVNELREKVDKKIKFPPGYYINYGGSFENLNEAKKRLAIAVPVSLALIFLLLFFAFNSVKHGLLIYTAIPLSAIGGIFFLALRGMPFSISAGVGFIALFGVAVLNGIVLIAEFNRLKNEGIKNLYQIVLTGTKVRLRPVLMTAFVASLGFLPMAISNGAGAEVQRPLATVVIGGLLLATFLTLFVLPVLYILFEAGIKIKTKPAASVLILLIFFSSFCGHAQNKINLQASIDTALKNNASVKNERLRAQYQQKIIKTAASIPQTSVVGEYGQINSSYADNRLGVSQSFNFPSVYVNQKSVFNEEWKTAVLTTALRESDLKKKVRQIFYTYLYLKEKEKLLVRNDSIYEAFLKKAELRFSSGESNVLEKVTAETQRGNISVQLKRLAQDLSITQLQFNLLLNSAQLFVPYESSPKLAPDLIADSSLIGQHPSLKVMEQQKRIAYLNRKLERSKLFPDLQVGYYNMTMKGFGADNVLYNYGTRFQSVQVGVGIPLFFSAQKSKIEAGKIQQSIAENSYIQESGILHTQFKSALKQYEASLATTNYYELTALKNARLISETAHKQFASGDISYLEWVVLTNQSISIQSDYLDALKNQNEIVIELNYLLSK
ncbi:MAG: CusA/CzcA family heavy metal efflux RND transporter, partial [Bacteroidia bacterium]